MAEQKRNRIAFAVPDYDEKILKTIPYYNEIYSQIIDLVKVLSFKADFAWLDTGGGTGTLVQKARRQFTQASFTLCDPSPDMLQTAKKKLEGCGCRFFCIPTQKLDFTEKFEVVTAVFSHHYLCIEQRKKAVQRCFEALKPNGVFISFENTLPNTPAGLKTGLARWAHFQTKNGKTKEEAKAHLQRFGTEVLPVTLSEQVALLKQCGFQTVELLWASYMQAGLYAIK